MSGNLMLLSFALTMLGVLGTVTSTHSRDEEFWTKFTLYSGVSTLLFAAYIWVFGGV